MWNRLWSVQVSDMDNFEFICFIFDAFMLSDGPKCWSAMVCHSWKSSPWKLIFFFMWSSIYKVFTFAFRIVWDVTTTDQIIHTFEWQCSFSTMARVLLPFKVNCPLHWHPLAHRSLSFGSCPANCFLCLQNDHSFFSLFYFIFFIIFFMVMVLIFWDCWSAHILVTYCPSGARHRGAVSRPALLC